MCKSQMCGIGNDKRTPCYHKLEEWSQHYSYQIGLGGSYSHDFKNIKIFEIVRHDRCIVCNFVRGRSSGTIYKR